jgi:hypothetical protein
MNVQTSDGPITLPRQFDDEGQPRPGAVWATQLVGQPPPYDGPFLSISLPYHVTGDAMRLRAMAERLLPRWQLELREVHVAQAITHDDAVALFRRWGW